MLLLYRDQLGKLPSKVVCQLFDNDNKVAIVAENVVNSTEKFLIDNARSDLVEDIREIVNEVLVPVTKDKINEVIQEDVLTLMTDYCLEPDYIGMIAVLERAPSVRPARRKKM